MLRKTKLYLDKTIKVESAESTSHAGNSSYKELSVFSRAQGKGEARGCAPRPSLHQESLSLCFLCLLLGQEGESAPSLGALFPVASAALGAISHIQEQSPISRSCNSSVLWWGLSPCTSRQPTVGCSLPASSFFLRAWFAFRFQLE